MKKINKKYLVLCGCVLVLLAIIIGFIIGIIHRHNSLFASPEQLTNSYLKSYIKEDSSILKKIEYPFEDTLNSSQEQRFKEIMKKQYRNMVYTIEEQNLEEVDGQIVVHVTVFDLKDSYDRANHYVESHASNFEKEDGSFDEEKAIDYKLSQLEDVKEKIDYSITFHFIKNKDNQWNMSDLSSSDIEKINGLF